MKHCTQCGHRLGLGRFCTNCGAPVAPAVAPPPPDDDWRSDTAERPRPRGPGADEPPPRVPPVALEPPPPPRFPLYADEVLPAGVATGTAAPPQPPPQDVRDDVQPEHLDRPRDEGWRDGWHDGWDDNWDDGWDDEREDERGAPRWRVAALVAVLVLALVASAWYVGSRLGGEQLAGDQGTAGDEASETASGRVDHTAEASAQAPSTAPPGEDVDGEPTSYDASNMLDGVPATTWRTAGDASGAKIVFTFDEPTRLTEVGLVNGYAKQARAGGRVLDWYEGHRRIQRVTWIFSGGDAVRQDLVESRDLQTVGVGPVEVTRVVLRIVATSEPGTGRASRDYTAISDVLLAEG